MIKKKRPLNKETFQNLAKEKMWAETTHPGRHDSQFALRNIGMTGMEDKDFTTEIKRLNKYLYIKRKL